jgi:hypothetical protein
MYMSLAKCSKRIQECAEAGQVGLSEWYALSQLPPEKQDDSLMALLQGASVKDVKRAARAIGNGQPTVRMPKVKIPLANETATGLVVVSGENLDLDDTETLLNEALKAVVAAKKKKLDCKTAQAVWRDMARAG